MRTPNDSICVSLINNRIIEILSKVSSIEVRSSTGIDILAMMKGDLCMGINGDSLFEFKDVEEMKHSNSFCFFIYFKYKSVSEVMFYIYNPMKKITHTDNISALNKKLINLKFSE